MPDHAPLNAILKAYVAPGPDGVARVDYAAFLKSPDRQRLKDYLASMAAVDVPSLAAPDQFAFWANLYNAVTLDVVADHYPVKSIRDIAISPGLFAVGPWGKPLITVGGKTLSLDDIEHKILRRQFKDPRIHYAVNCASTGCPDLGPTAFEGQTLEAQLEAAARRFINHPRGVRIEDGGIVASRIFDWYSEDFTGLPGGGLMGHLLRYAEPPLGEQLTRLRRIARYDYDWTLNDILR